MSTITSSQRSITSNVVNKKATSHLLSLTAVQPSDAANFARHLGAFLLGGQRRRLSVDIVGGAASSQSLNAMGAMANLIMLDRNLVDDASLRQLYLNILLPFYDEFEVVRGNVRQLGVHQIVRNVMDDAGYQLPEVTQMTSIRGRAVEVTRATTRALRVLLLAVRNNRFEAIAQENQLYNKRDYGNAPLSPFAARNDIVDIILYGTRTDLGESRMHDVNRYRPEAVLKATTLKNYADLLSKKIELEGLDLAVGEAMGTKTHIAKSHAIFMDTFVRASVHTEMLAPNADAGNNYYDVVELPYFGALGYLLYGISSSEIMDSTNEYVRFQEIKIPTVPSLYPMYIYVERCLIQMAYDTFKSGRGNANAPEYGMLLTHRELVIDAVIDALGVFFESVDPDSRDRVSYMFDAASTNEEFVEGDENFMLPPSMTTNLFKEAITSGTNDVDRLGGVDLKGSFMSEEELARVNNVNPYARLIDHVDKFVDEVYVNFEPIEPTKLITVSNGTAFVYVRDDDDDANYVDFDDVIRASVYVDSDKFSVESAIQATKFYVRRNLGGAARRNVKGFKIKKIRTSFELKPHKGLSDISVDAPTITIDRDAKRKDFDFEVSPISIYYHLITDKQLLNERAVQDELNYLRAFTTHVSIKKETLQRYLMNFLNVNPMSPGIYTTIDGERLDDDQISHEICVRDGEGIPFSGALTLTSRESEEYTISNIINTKDVF
jgi:hypothetical protein